MPEVGLAELIAGILIAVASWLTGHRIGRRNGKSDD